LIGHRYYYLKGSVSFKGSGDQCKVWKLDYFASNSFCVSEWLSSVFKHFKLLDWLVWFCCLVVICPLSKASYRAFSEFEWERLPQSTKHLGSLAWKDPNAVGETI